VGGGTSKIAADACSAIEGGVTAGIRRLIRFTVMTPNVGDADIFLGDPNEHVAANDGLYEFASCHNIIRTTPSTRLIDPRPDASGRRPSVLLHAGH